MCRGPLAVLAVAVLALAACSDGDDTKPPSATVDTTERTTTSEPRTPEEEVEAAYLKSWDVYAKAVRTLDPSGLEASYAEEALTTVRAEVERLASEETPLIVQVEHEIHVQIADSTTALVRDRYVNRNYRTDGDGKPLDDPDDPGTYVETYQMKRMDGTWRVVRIVRESYQP